MLLHWRTDRAPRSDQDTGRNTPSPINLQTFLNYGVNQGVKRRFGLSFGRDTARHRRVADVVSVPDVFSFKFSFVTLRDR